MCAWVLCGRNGEDRKKIVEKIKAFSMPRSTRECEQQKSCFCSAPYFMSWIHRIGWVVLFILYNNLLLFRYLVGGVYVLRSIRISATFQLSRFVVCI